MNKYALSMDYKEQEEWNEMPMWMEMALGAISGGLFIFSIIFKFGMGAIVALLLMLVGKGAVLLADLGRPERFFNVFLQPGKSWLSKGAWALALFGVVGAVSVAPLIFPSLSWLPWSGGGGKLLGLAGGLLAAFLMTYDGLMLGESKGVAFWTNGGLPMVLLTSAAAGGLGALMALAPIGGLTVSTGVLGILNTAVLAVAGISLYAFIRTSSTGTGGAKVSAEILSTGELSSTFNIWAVGAGIVVPISVSMLSILGVSIPSFAWTLTGLLEIIGVVALRYCILGAGTYSPQI